MEYTMYLVKLTVESTGEEDLAFLYEERVDADRKADDWNKFQLERGEDCIAEVKKVFIKELD